MRSVLRSTCLDRVWIVCNKLIFKLYQRGIDRFSQEKLKSKNKSNNMDPDPMELLI